MTFFKNEYDAKVCLMNLLPEVSFGQSDAICTACERWDMFDKVKDLLGVKPEDVYDAVLELKQNTEYYFYGVLANPVK